jgi:hypothetical protein
MDAVSCPDVIGSLYKCVDYIHPVSSASAGLVRTADRRSGEERVASQVQAARSASTMPKTVHAERAIKKISRACLAMKPRTGDILDSGLGPAASAEVDRHKQVCDYEGDDQHCHDKEHGE